ncbi:MFS general substrate transporter [Sarocladium strictum]
MEGQELATADYSGVRKKTDPKEIRLVRKLDCIMMPTLWIMYFLNYLDRNAITVARLDGMEDDLGLVGNQYLTAVSILFVGYILGQLPATMIMTRVRPSLFMATWMAIWAIVSGLTGIARNYTGLVVTRFFLGVAEAPFYPGALFMLSCFYTKKEIATRISVLYTANICGTAFAGLIAIGVFKMDGTAGLEGWRWLFILLGIITFFVSIASAFLLPDEPINTRWLSPEERQLAHDRMAADTVERKANTATFAGLKEAAKDYRLWVLIVMYHFHMAASNFKNFFPTIVETLGYETNTTLALTCPPYLVSGVITIAWGYSSGRFNERTWHITVSKLVAIFGFVLACTTSNVGARYFAMCCFATGVYACNSVIIGWIASTCGQTKEKKAAAIGMANTIANLSPIYSPYLWPAWNAPRYVIPMVASAAFSFVALVLAWVMRRILIKENRRIRASTTESTLFYPY